MKQSMQGEVRKSPENAGPIAVVLFDLDDTLYPEIEYVRSGFRAVSRVFASSAVSPDRMLTWMEEFFVADRHHVFDALAARLILTDFSQGHAYNPDTPGSRLCCPDRGSTRSAEISTLALKMIECYRGHTPEIHLYPDAARCLETMRARHMPIGLITDGLAAVQEKKVQALGLEEVFDLIIYTDHLGPDRLYWKPSPRAFEIAAGHFGVSPTRCCYVCDNPTKDFAGPAQLGMPVVWVRRAGGIYANASPPEGAFKSLETVHARRRAPGGRAPHSPDVIDEEKDAFWAESGQDGRTPEPIITLTDLDGLLAALELPT